jgi:ArsR family transcriptional regulator, cadmium/lead-responsive transcriptional repressor
VATAPLDLSLRAELAHGLSDPSRQRILDLLRDGERRPSDVVEATGLSQPNVSKHLRCLRGCGLVTAEKRGREVFYSLVDGLEEVLNALDALLVHVAPQMAACELTDAAVGSCE